MRILLDTHFMFWLSSDQAQLKRPEIELLADADTETMGSAVGLWELALKWERFHVSGARKGPASPALVLDWFDEARIVVVPLTPRQAAARLNEAIGHSDPFDRILLVQAQELDARLLTRDGRLADHPLALQL